MVIYSPNPTSAIGSLRVSLLQDEMLDVSVTDLTGKMIKSLSRSAMFYKGTTEQKINVGAMSNGLYFLRVRSASINETIRFTVNHE